MEFIFQYPDVHGPDAEMLSAGSITDIALSAERAGWGALALTEHPAPGARWLAAGGHQSLDPFVGLAVAAAVTSRLKLITYLTVVPYRNPLLLAKTAMTLDRVSNGRFILGIGTGYLKGEFLALGVDFEERNALMDEALEVMPLHWSGEPFDYAGRHFTARGTQSRPTPTGPTVPIWIGGNAHVTLRRVADTANGWMPMIASAEISATTRTTHIDGLHGLTDRIAVLRDLAGERFDELAISVPYADPNIAADHAGLDVERHREAFERYREVGATHILITVPSKPAPWTAEFLESFGATFIDG